MSLSPPPLACDPLASCPSALLPYSLLVHVQLLTLQQSGHLGQLSDMIIKLQKLIMTHFCYHSYKYSEKDPPEGIKSSSSELLKALIIFTNQNT